MFLTWLKIFISYIISSFYILLLHYSIDMYLLNNNVVLFILILLAIIMSFLIFGIFTARTKITKIIIGVIYVIMLAVNVVGVYYLYNTSSFIESFDNKVEEKATFYLVVSNDSKINKEIDLINKRIGITNDTSKVMTLDIECEMILYSSITNLINDLYEGKIDAILISDIEEYALEEYYDKFKNRIKIIKKYDKEIINESDNNSEEEKETVVEEKKNPVIAYDPFILYISGIDNNGSISARGRSDVNILMTVNPKTRQILLTSIPRDYYVQLNGTTGIKDKLTHAGIYGIDKSILTIEDLLKVDINYYVKINFNTVVNLIDAIGGINVYSDKSLNFCNIKKGNNYLNGDCALRFVRERKSFGEGDRKRGVNQERVITAIIDKMSSSSELLYNYTDILNSLKNNFVSNVEPAQIKQLVGVQLSGLSSWDVKTLNLDGFNSSNYTYSGGDMILWVMEPDINTINNARIAITEVLSGKKFSDILVLN